MNNAFYNVIKRPCITEKGTIAKEKNNKYVFEVLKAASKNEIRAAIEQLFNVSVCSINTLVIMGKVKRVGKSIGRQGSWKKAVITLKEGDTIDFFKGV